MSIGQTPSKGEGLTRRNVLKGAAAAMATISIVPRHVLGGPGNRPPSETPVVAGVGIGGVGHGSKRAMTPENPTAYVSDGANRLTTA